jgi:signal peptidase I
MIFPFALLQVIKHYVAQSSYVVGNSMSPTLKGRDSGPYGDQILVEKIAYRFRKPLKGEVVLINTKGVINPNLKQGAHYVRRITGLPGETVNIGNEEKRLGPNEYLVADDNAETDIGTRLIGPIGRKNIIGRAVYIYFPFDRLGKIE